jgi:hypothetical protein
MIRYDMIYDVIYLTAIGLTLGGSNKVHIYTRTIHRTTQKIHRTTHYRHKTIHIFHADGNIISMCRRFLSAKSERFE